jgi:hypothetical protein
LRGFSLRWGSETGPSPERVQLAIGRLFLASQLQRNSRWGLSLRPRGGNPNDTRTAAPNYAHATGVEGGRQERSIKPHDLAISAVQLIAKLPVSIRPLTCVQSIAKIMRSHRCASLGRGRKINSPNPRRRSARRFHLSAVATRSNARILPTDRCCFFDFCEAGLTVSGSVVDPFAT